MSSEHPVAEAIVVALQWLYDQGEVEGSRLEDVAVTITVKQPELVPTKTKIAYHMRHLVTRGVAVRTGLTRATRYRIAEPNDVADDLLLELSEDTE